MTFDEAKAIVEQIAAIGKDGGFYNLGRYMAWTPGNTRATLDDQFDAEELIALGTYMKEFK